ncbi:MAG: ABC transporter permease [Myxococcales bacterium]|nr:MAG: ABC transporter permease [Myxococcales bacterium]
MNGFSPPERKNGRGLLARWAEGLVAAVAGFVVRLGEIGLFFLGAVRAAFRPPQHVGEWVRVMNGLGWRCLIPVVCVVGPMGAAVSLQGAKILELFGAQHLLSSMLSIVILREISPVMASMMVASQAGSSIAAELGAMRVKEEIDALEVMAVNPIQRVVVPRLLAGLIITPLLNAFAGVVGLVGGYLVAVPIQGMNVGTFMANLYLFVGPMDVVVGFIKTSIFGLAITTIACYYGFHVKGGAEGVGRAANRTVADSVVVVIILNYVLSSFFYSDM